MSSNHSADLGAGQSLKTTTADDPFCEYELMFVITGHTIADLCTSTQIVVLKSRGKAITHASLSDLEEVMRKPWMAARIELASESAGLSIHNYEMATSERVVRFFGEMVKSWGVNKALALSRKVGQGESADEPHVVLHFCRVINHFADSAKYNSDIYDSLIDWFIRWLKDGSVKDFNKTFNTCMANDIFGSGGLIRVCVNVFVHHNEEMLNGRTANRMKLWLRVHTNRHVRHTIPGDVMSAEFDDWCAYHHHGAGELCYLQKSDF
ncbi:hypothetical protein D6C78_09852 [Aureobasidium pullulans]|uniref:Uncharacterized protein n=1 Tax=Aureobasidium pullulans TaxID=5580 RepID=A0A4T0B8T9_AURPU|nr:hypothetical protein D6C78_09852 [Aureobasidium pullulans]